MDANSATLTNWTAAAIILATLLGPIVAVQVQKLLERRQERMRAKNEAFKVLMATRFFSRDLLNTSETNDATSNTNLYQRRDDAFWSLLHLIGQAVG